MSIELIIFFSIQRSWYPQQKSYWGWRYHEHLLLSIKFHLCLFIRNLWKTCRILWHFYLQQLVSVFMFWTDGLGEEGSDHKNAQGAFVCQINRVLSFYPIFIKFALLKKKKRDKNLLFWKLYLQNHFMNMRVEKGNYVNVNVNEFEECIFKIEIAIPSAVKL